MEISQLKEKIEELRNQNAELRDELEVKNAELNKEKEKREIAEENHKVLSLDLGKALKELGLYEDTIIADELVLEINKNYVSKDKIKAKIEELKPYKEYIPLDNRYTYKEVVSYGMEILQELLEEEG